MSKSADSKNNSVVLTNPERRLFGRGFYGVVIVILFGFFAFQLWFHATRTSATIDEPLRILAGYQHWCGDFGINPQHPPLFKMLATVPLLGKGLLQPPWDCGSQITSQADAYFFGNLFLVQNGVDRVVIPARLSAALTSFLLALLVFLAANEMFGRWAGLPALGLLVFEPNIIAHGALVTTDMPVTLGFFCAVYALYRYVKNPAMLRLLTVGLAVGLTLTAKHSGVLILPIIALLLVGDVFVSRSRSFENKPSLVKQFLHRISACAGFFLIGFTLLWATYGFRYYALPITTTNTLSVENRVSHSRSGHVIALINQMRVLPESYVYGLTDVVATWRRPTYIFDRFYPNGKWFYFPLAFVVKTSTALLFLLGVGLLTLRLYRDHKREMLFLLLPSLLYFALSLSSGINIGVRHLLPVYPFFIVAAAGTISFWSRKYEAVKYISIALLLFHAVATAQTAPNYVAFANDFWGGTNNTYRIFRYSNVEYQQNSKLVAEYIAREKIRGCWFAAYGSNELARAYQPCQMMPALLGLWSTLNVSEQVEEPVPPIIEGTLFLSVTVLPPAPFAEYLPVAQTVPVAQIGGSIFVYRGRFQVPLLAALSHARRAQQLVRRERFEEAVADGRKAVELAPDDPRTHFWLGMSLANAKQTHEARRELEMVIQLKQTEGDYVLSGLRQKAEQELKHLQ
jgi:tetratricopeptide (TPR) repeat protein